MEIWKNVPVIDDKKEPVIYYSGLANKKAVNRIPGKIIYSRPRKATSC